MITPKQVAEAAQERKRAEKAANLRKMDELEGHFDSLLRGGIFSTKYPGDYYPSEVVKATLDKYLPYWNVVKDNGYLVFSPKPEEGQPRCLRRLATTKYCQLLKGHGGPCDED